jgi:hypothetical protein
LAGLALSVFVTFAADDTCINLSSTKQQAWSSCLSLKGEEPHRWLNSAKAWQCVAAEVADARGSAVACESPPILFAELGQGWGTPTCYDGFVVEAIGSSSTDEARHAGGNHAPVTTAMWKCRCTQSQCKYTSDDIDDNGLYYANVLQYYKFKAAVATGDQSSLTEANKDATFDKINLEFAKYQGKRDSDADALQLQTPGLKEAVGDTPNLKEHHKCFLECMASHSEDNCKKSIDSKYESEACQDWTPNAGCVDLKDKMVAEMPTIMSSVNDDIKQQCEDKGGTHVPFVRIPGRLTVQEARKSGLVAQSRTVASVQQDDITAQPEDTGKLKITWQMLYCGGIVMGRVASKNGPDFCGRKISSNEVDIAFREHFATARFKIAKEFTTVSGAIAAILPSEV